MSTLDVFAQETIIRMKGHKMTPNKAHIKSIKYDLNEGYKLTVLNYEVREQLNDDINKIYTFDELRQRMEIEAYCELLYKTMLDPVYNIATRKEFKKRLNNAYREHRYMKQLICYGYVAEGFYPAFTLLQFLNFNNLIDAIKTISERSEEYLIFKWERHLGCPIETMVDLGDPTKRTWYCKYMGRLMAIHYATYGYEGLDYELFKITRAQGLIKYLLHDKYDSLFRDCTIKFIGKAAEMDGKYTDFERFHIDIKTVELLCKYNEANNNHPSKDLLSYFNGSGIYCSKRTFKRLLELISVTKNKVDADKQSYLIHAYDELYCGLCVANAHHLTMDGLIDLIKSPHYSNSTIFKLLNSDLFIKVMDELRSRSVDIVYSKTYKVYIFEDGGKARIEYGYRMLFSEFAKWKRGDSDEEIKRIDENYDMYRLNVNIFRNIDRIVEIAGRDTWFRFIDNIISAKEFPSNSISTYDLREGFVKAFHNTLCKNVYNKEYLKELGTEIVCETVVHILHYLPSNVVMDLSSNFVDKSVKHATLEQLGYNEEQIFFLNLQNISL